MAARPPGGALLAGLAARARRRQAGRIAAETLIGSIQPFALPIIEEHRAAGRAVVLATTTPYDLIKPLADALGLDDVDRDSLRRRATARTTARSTASSCGARESCERSGSGLMSTTYRWQTRMRTPTVGTTPRCSRPSAIPFAVNPDPRLMVRASVAALADPAPRRAERRAEGARRRAPAGDDGGSAGPSSCRTRGSTSAAWRTCPSRVPRSWSRTTAATSTRWRWAWRCSQRGRPVRFLGKKEVFDVPVVGQLAKAIGGIRVDRGTGSDEPSAGGRRRAPRPARWWRSCRRARSRVVTRSSTPS